MVKLSNRRWTFKSPGAASATLIAALYDPLLRVVAQVQDKSRAWKLAEALKAPFATAAGYTPSSSTNFSFAKQDIERDMRWCSANAPVFIQTYVNTCEGLAHEYDDLNWPDIELVNGLLQEHEPHYAIVDDVVVQRGDGGGTLAVPDPVPPLSLDEESRALIVETIGEARQLLTTPGKERQAVEEILWLLETLTTAFNGAEPSEELGKYFNKIIDALRLRYKGTAFDHIMGWMKTLHGYLSAPGGGGIRHGTNLLKPKKVDPAEAKLYVNLIMSYLGYLMDEYDRISAS